MSDCVHHQTAEDDSDLDLVLLQSSSDPDTRHKHTFCPKIVHILFFNNRVKTNYYYYYYYYYIHLMAFSPRQPR